MPSHRVHQAQDEGAGHALGTSSAMPKGMPSYGEGYSKAFLGSSKAMPKGHPIRGKPLRSRLGIIKSKQCHKACQGLCQAFGLCAKARQVLCQALGACQATLTYWTHKINAKRQSESMGYAGGAYLAMPRGICHALGSSRALHRQGVGH
jgi:hypothetical protein